MACLPFAGGIAWQLPHDDVGVGDGVDVARAVVMAERSEEASVERNPIPPVLPFIAFCILVTETPALADVANCPWQAAQLALYRDAPSGVADTGVGTGAGEGTGVDVVRAATIASISVTVRPENDPIPPVLLLIAFCRRVTVIPDLLEEASEP